MIEFLFDKLSQIKYNYLTNDISYEDRWKVLYLFFFGYLTVADKEEYKKKKYQKYE